MAEDLARGERIKALRNAKSQQEGRRVTQPEVAEAVGVSLRAYQEWEAGGGIELDNATALAKFFGVRHTDILDEDEPEQATPDVVATLNGKRETQDEWRERMERKLDAVIKLVAVLAEDETETAEQEAARAAEEEAEQHDAQPGEDDADAGTSRPADH